MTALLDANVLIALAWEHHVHHKAAHKWFQANRQKGWATCPLTQAAFVRVSCVAAVVEATISVPEALEILAEDIAVPEHEFWSLDKGLTQVLPEMRRQLTGRHQLTDALLLDLAIRKGGKLVTFDRGVANLLPQDSQHREAIEVLPAE